MPLSFRPACLPVAQSGLPYTHASQALSFLRHQLSTLITWPHLPQRGLRDQMYVQTAIGYPGLIINEQTQQVFVDLTQAEYGLDALALAYLQNDMQAGAYAWEDAVGLSALLRSPAQLKGYKAIVSHLVGPISLGLQLTDDQQRPILEMPVLREALVQHLSLRVAWLTERLSHLVDDVIICLDEPYLSVLGTSGCSLEWDEGIALLEQVLSSTSGCRGLILSQVGQHTQARSLSPGWSDVLDTSMEWLVFNVYDQGDELVAVAERLPTFLEQHGTLVWGLIPAQPTALAHETYETLLARFDCILDSLTARGLSRQHILLASLISTSDHLSYLSEETAEYALRLCTDVSTRLRAREQLDGE